MAAIHENYRCQIERFKAYQVVYTVIKCLEADRVLSEQVALELIAAFKEEEKQC